MPILRLTIVLILAALWVVPAPVRAHDDTTCHPPHSAASVYVGVSSEVDVVVTNVSGAADHGSGPLQLQLHGVIERDGTAAVHGVVLLGEGRERSVLVAVDTSCP